MTIIGKDKKDFSLVAYQFELENMDSELYILSADDPYELRVKEHSCHGFNCMLCDFIKDKKIHFVLMFLLLCFGISCQKTYELSDSELSLLENTEKSLQEIQTVVFKTTRIKKPFSSKDTLYDIAICSLYIHPDDKIGMYFVSNSVYGDTLSHFVYDGKNVSIMNLYFDGKIKTKGFENVNLEQNNYNIEGYGATGLLSRFVFDPNQTFTGLKKKSERDHIKNMDIQEEIFNETPVYVLSIFSKNYEDRDDYVNNGVDKYYIRKSDFLPVVHSTYGEFEDMKGYDFTTIEYLAINTLSREDFVTYTKIEDADVEAIYKQNQPLVESDFLKNRKKKKENRQKVVKAAIKDNKLPFNEFVLNNGKTVRLSELKGKVVLLDFWYRGCLPCLKATPDLIKLQKEFKDDLVIIGVNDRDDRDQVTDYYTYKNNTNYFSTYKSDIHISRSLNINAFPTFIIIDQEGKIVKTKVGFNKNEIRKTIRDLIRNN